MKLNNIFLALLCLLTSCANELVKLEGYWQKDFDEVVNSSFFPYQLHFHRDTLSITNSSAFKQHLSYQIIEDSILIRSKNGAAKKYPFEILSDSTLRFENVTFFRTLEDYLNPYHCELLAWESSTRFIPEENAVIIHLIKYKGVTKVILNDAIADLEQIPRFLMDEAERRPIHLYLGEGVSVKDLIDTYCWLKIYNYQMIELVTSSGPFDEFHSVKDYINLDKAMFDRFYEDTRLPPIPQKETESDEITDIYVDTRRDLEVILDSTTYRLNISSRLKVTEYLEITEMLGEKKKNVILRWVE